MLLQFLAKSQSPKKAASIFTGTHNSVTISGMVRRDERGSVALLIALGSFIVLFITATILAVVAYSSRQDYKNNTDKKIAAAVALAVKQEASRKEADFVQREKNPYKTYSGPETFGKVTIKYPKTWSAQVDEKGSGNTVLDGYFHPNFVPGLQSATNFALRLQILQTDYAEVLRQFESPAKEGEVHISPYVAPKEAGITGARIEGKLDPQKSGQMVLLPLRDKTIKIWTESNAFFNDFDKITLANLTFVR
jgi:hypothetical protein